MGVHSPATLPFREFVSELKGSTKWRQTSGGQVGGSLKFLTSPLKDEWHDRDGNSHSHGLVFQTKSPALFNLVDSLIRWKNQWAYNLNLYFSQVEFLLACSFDHLRRPWRHHPLRHCKLGQKLKIQNNRVTSGYLIWWLHRRARVKRLNSFVILSLENHLIFSVNILLTTSVFSEAFKHLLKRFHKPLHQTPKRNDSLPRFAFNVHK